MAKPKAQDADEQTETDEKVESLEDFLQRKEKRDKKARAEDVDDEEALIEAMDEREGRAESLAVNVVPEQPEEFTCRGCFLMKHRSQLKNKRKQLCADCA